MIVLDVETSGTDPQRHSLISIGAVDWNSDADSIYQALGMPEEPKPHNALTGAKWEKLALKKFIND